MPEQGVRVRLLWRPPRVTAERYYEDDLALVPSLVWKLRRGPYDIAHALAPAFGWGAAQARRIGGPQFALSVPGTLRGIGSSIGITASR